MLEIFGLHFLQLKSLMQKSYVALWFSCTFLETLSMNVESNNNHSPLAKERLTLKASLLSLPAAESEPLIFACCTDKIEF